MKVEEQFDNFVSKLCELQLLYNAVFSPVKIYSESLRVK